ncbi:MAG: cation transporter, partial [Salinivirgaceae bacterium]|nr:cation transporter [Salinivirgaceae bacterium]
MKNIIMLSLLIVFVAINGTKVMAQEKQKVTFTVNMTCNHCKLVIMKNIPYEKGVKDVSVDLDKKEVTILFRKDKITTDQLIKAFEKIGYTAVLK